MKNLIYILLTCAVIALSACSTQRFNINTQPVDMDTPTYEGTNHFIFWGLQQTQTMNPGRVCGESGVNYVETKETFVNGLLGALTWGIYAPRTYAVYCNNPNLVVQ